MDRNFSLYFLRKSIDFSLARWWCRKMENRSLIILKIGRNATGVASTRPIGQVFSNTLFVQLFVASKKKKKKGRAFVVTNSKRRKVKPSRWPRCHSDRCNLISRVGFETKQRSRIVWRYEISPLLWTKQAVWFFSFFLFSLSFSSPVKQVKACVEAPLNALTM